MSTALNRAADVEKVRDHASIIEGPLDAAATGFGLSAAIVIIFNTVLAWIKDAWDPLNSFMAWLTGHHWITHGVVDVALFVVLGLVFMRRGLRMDGTTLAAILGAAAIIGGGGLALWFVVF
jgi:hypothetical protein